MGHYRLLDDIALADCGVDVSGRSLGDVFETAARAIAEVAVDTDTLSTTVARIVTIEAPSLDLLLFDWLSELIYRIDRDGEVYSGVRVRIGGGGPYRLCARLRGGCIVPGRTERRADIKGVTFHQFVLEPAEGGWHARFVVDL